MTVNTGVMHESDTVDAANTVVKLCADGMAAEAAGRAEHARALFAEAWRACSDDYEACIAAHYVARHQATAEATLWWNMEALRRADAADSDRVRSFYPSLYLNAAYAFEQVGQTSDACRHYALAAVRLDDLPTNGYAAMIRGALARGQERTCGTTPAGFAANSSRPERER
jgi:hypothetical protein